MFNRLLSLGTWISLSCPQAAVVEAANAVLMLYTHTTGEELKMARTDTTWTACCASRCWKLNGIKRALFGRGRLQWRHGDCPMDVVPRYASTWGGKSWAFAPLSMSRGLMLIPYMSSWAECHKVYCAEHSPTDPTVNGPKIGPPKRCDGWHSSWVWVTDLNVRINSQTNWASSFFRAVPPDYGGQTYFAYLFSLRLGQFPINCHREAKRGGSISIQIRTIFI